MNRQSQEAEHNTYGYEHRPHFITVTHPYHPLKGQRVEIIRANRGLGIVVRLDNGKSLKLPVDYTDYVPTTLSEDQTPSSHITHFHSADALRGMIKFIQQITLRSESQESEEAKIG